MAGLINCPGTMCGGLLTLLCVKAVTSGVARYFCPFIQHDPARLPRIPLPAPRVHPGCEKCYQLLLAVISQYFADARAGSLESRNHGGCPLRGVCRPARDTKIGSQVPSDFSQNPLGFKGLYHALWAWYKCFSFHCFQQAPGIFAMERTRDRGRAVYM